MNVDVRGFQYSLEALLQQRRWQLERLIARLGLLQSEIDALEREARAAEAQAEVAVIDARQRLLERLSGGQHQMSLRHIARLKQTALEFAENLHALHERRTALRADCARAQCELEAVEAHRGEALQDFEREEVGRDMRRRDAEWIALAARRAGAPTPSRGQA